MSELSESQRGDKTATSPLYPSQETSPPAGQASAADKLSDLKDKAVDDLSQIGHVATDQAQAAVDLTAEKASEQKNIFAAQLSSVAKALEKAGSELERDNQPSIGRYTRDLGNSARKIADDLRDRDIGEVVSIAEDVGRRQPAAFLGLAALAGFAASRFVTASAMRRPASSSTNSMTSAGTQATQNGMAGAGADKTSPRKEGSYNV